MENGLLPRFYKQTSEIEKQNVEQVECTPAPCLLLNWENYQVQSGVVDVDSTTAVVTQEENIGFVDEDTPDVEMLPPLVDPSFREDSDELADLSSYLSRPVVIDTFTWSESDTFTTTPHTVYPWEAFFGNTFIKKKIENYARVNCTLKVTIRFNASPFYYGLMRAIYDPLNSSRFDPASAVDLIPMSQTPGMYLEPQTTSSCEMTLPFLWPNNWLDVTNTNEFHHMGKLFFEIFSPLRSANGVASTGISVTTYVHAENVIVAGPTAKLALQTQVVAPSELVIQSGVVSKPATAVAKYANYFTSIPVIGPFARAINVGASAVSAIAHMFGYSNPPVLDNVTPVHPTAFSEFANVDVSAPNEVLALDPNNQVTIDNRVTGADSSDDLAIANLVQRESYLSQTTWTSSDSTGTKLFSIAVTPCPGLDVAATSQTFLYHTPASFAGRMFRFWHGTMVYKIKVVKSKYNKGRLLVVWDPAGLVAPIGVETAVFTKVFDLSTDDDEFEFVVPYKSHWPWLSNKFTQNSLNVRTDAVFDKTEHNGTITVSVQNVLTGPAASPAVDVLIYSYGKEDVQFAGPRPLPQNTTIFGVQSGAVDGSALSYSEHLPEITVGERVASLRALLHRTTHSITQVAGVFGPAGSPLLAGIYHTTNRYNRLPPEWGFADAESFGWTTSILGTGNKRCNYARTHPINWVLAAFAGYRGSVVAHASVNGEGGGSKGINSIVMDRTWASAIIGAAASVRNVNYDLRLVTDGPSFLSYITSVDMDPPAMSTGQGGMTLTQGRTQMGCSAVIPQYNPCRFYPTWYKDVIPNAPVRSAGTRLYDGFRVDLNFHKDDTTTTVFPEIDLYYSTGVDFNPVFFVGVPRLYRYVMGVPVVNL